MPVDNELHKAAHKGDLEVCKAILEGQMELEEPVNVNDPGASDRRALHRAAGAGHLDICHYFFEKGADVDAVSKAKTWLFTQLSQNKHCCSLIYYMPLF
ncbi:hypothetical protein EON65_07795 [archaeon]|nr:MAG: hypothetical protein EON65_07795 [archaeon]